MRSILALFAAAAIVAACGSPQRAPSAPKDGKPSSGDAPALVPVGQLPERERAVLADYGRGGEAWEARRAEVLADPGLAAFLVDNLVLEMVRAHRAVDTHSGDRARAAFERARAELVRAGEAAVPVLAQLLETADNVVAKLAADVLVQIGRPAVEEVVALLASPQARARQRSAALLGALESAGEGEADVRAALVARLRGDPEWAVRAQAALAVGQRGARDRESRPWRLALEAALRDADPAVAEAAAQGLLVHGDPLAVPALLAALERAVQGGDLRGVGAVQQALRGLTGETRQLDLRGWEAWWARNRERIEGRRAAAPRGGGTGPAHR